MFIANPISVPRKMGATVFFRTNLMLFQRGVIFLRSVSRSDRRRSLHHYRARSDGEVKARDRAVQDIGDEDPGVVELVVDGQVPRTVQLRREGGGPSLETVSSPYRGPRVRSGESAHQGERPGTQHVSSPRGPDPAAAGDVPFLGRHRVRSGGCDQSSRRRNPPETGPRLSWSTSVHVQDRLAGKFAIDKSAGDCADLAPWGFDRDLRPQPFCGDQIGEQREADAGALDAHQFVEQG